MKHGKCGRPKALKPKAHRYNFRLDDDQELKFRQMLSEAGMEKNISKFVISRIFG